MFKSSIINRLSTKLQHWKETARQKQDLQLYGVALAKDMGISYETLMLEAQHPNRNDMTSAVGIKQLKPVVNIRSKIFHKI